VNIKRRTAKRENWGLALFRLALAGLIALSYCVLCNAQERQFDSASGVGVNLTGTVAPKISRSDDVHASSPSGKFIRTKASDHDTLQIIAGRWNASAELLARLNGVATDVELQAGREVIIPAPPSVRSVKRSRREAAKRIPDNVVARDRLMFQDKSVVEADEIWEDANGYWYKRNGVANFVERSRVKSFDRSAPVSINNSGEDTLAKVEDVNGTQQLNSEAPVWIYLVGGAKVEVDEVNETAQGAWYKRGSLSIFIEKSRIERIERELPRLAAKGTPAKRWSERGWSTGNAKLDNLIRHNGGRFGVDPYFIFCVMEQESHFNSRALSPKGAQGLMQLMPGTAARFGVRRPFDASQNIAGGTRYLKTLLASHNNRVDLVLASYNAGEGAVAKYGQRVPPYKETRDYVKKISKQYDRIKPGGSDKPALGKDSVSKIR